MRRRSRLLRALIVVSAFVLLLAVPAVADVDNGGFETPEPTGAWDTFDTVDDWTIQWTAGVEGCAGELGPVLEIQKSGTVVNAFEGNQYVELDTDCQPYADTKTNVRISQILNLDADYNYDLTYAFRQRTSGDSMVVTFPGGTVTEDGTTGATTAKWTKQTRTFTAVAASTISFEETGTPDTLGMFLDDVDCEFCESETTSELVYGRKNIPVGDITVTHDEDTFFVDIMTSDNWVIYKTHVDLVADPEDFPQNRGGLIPGQFTYGSGPFIPGVMSDTIEIDVPDGWLPGEYYIAVHAELFEVSDVGMYWATSFSDVNQLLTKGGAVIQPPRDDPNDVLGAPDATGSPSFTGFFSLGFGGSIVVEFGAPIYNGTGDDLAGVEVTSGSSYPLEKAMVEFYYDGAWYEAAEELTNDAAGLQRETFIEMPMTIPYAEKVRITDTTDPAVHNNNADGFDIDAVKAVQLWLGEESGWGDTNGVTVGRNWSMYFPIDFNCPQ